jgi:putative addiction module killer protein
MLPLHMSRNIEFSEYLDANGKSPFAKWFDDLDAIAAAKVRVHMTRVELGNYSNVEPIGEGLSEIKIDFGPGYRVYFRSEIGFLLLLLGGSSKKGQQKAINAAKTAWKLYQLDRKQPAQKVKRK